MINLLTISVNNCVLRRTSTKTLPGKPNVSGAWKLLMLYLVLGLGAIALSTTLFTNLIKKQRLSDDKIRGAAMRVLMIELSELREERSVMRNLLRDIMDNEALVQQATAAMPDDDRVRLLRYRKQRRFELFGESLAVLGEMKPAVANWRKDARELS